MRARLLLVAAALCAMPAAAQAPRDAPLIRNDLRIVGGTVAPEGAWPTQIALYVDRRYACGGSLVDRAWVLTAAHCVVDPRSGRARAPASLQVREGSQDLGRGGRALGVARVVVHEAYTPGRERPLVGPANDIALLQLAQPSAQPRVQLVAAAGAAALVEPGALATVIGWGHTAAREVSQRLREVSVPIVARADCAAALGRFGFGADTITDRHLCAGYAEGGRDSCNGDSGGPLFVRSALGEPVQVGVVSWGPGCARAGGYGVYTAVAAQEDWIRRHVRQASFAGTPAGAFAPATAALAPGVAAPGAAPSADGARVTVDILPGGAMPVGRVVQVRVASTVAGALLVFNENVAGETYLIFPNRALAAQGGAGRTRTTIGAGETVTIPAVYDGFVMRLREPPGENRLLAVVVPDTPEIAALVAPHLDGRPIPDAREFVDSLGRRLRALRDVHVEPARRPSAVAERVYTILPRGTP